MIDFIAIIFSFFRVTSVEDRMISLILCEPEQEIEDKSNITGPNYVKKV